MKNIHPKNILALVMCHEDFVEREINYSVAKVKLKQPGSSESLPANTKEKEGNPNVVAVPGTQSMMPMELIDDEQLVDDENLLGSLPT